MHGTWKSIIDCFLPVLCLGPLLASCTFPPPRKPTGPTATPAAPTPIPSPLAQASGRTEDYVSRDFVAPAGGWHVAWEYFCTGQAFRHSNHRLTIDAREVHPRIHPHSVTVVSVTIAATDASGGSRGAGTRAATMRGYVYLHMHVPPGCSWRLTARSGL